jgi:hypothetical protein
MIYLTLLGLVWATTLLVLWISCLKHIPFPMKALLMSKHLKGIQLIVWGNGL